MHQSTTPSPSRRSSQKYSYFRSTTCKKMARLGLLHFLCKTVYNVITLAASLCTFYLVLSSLKIEIVSGTEDPLPPISDGPDYLNFLQGYDCSNPKELQASDYSAITNCQSDLELTVSNNRSYQILRVNLPTLREGYTCRVHETRKVRYCGQGGRPDRYSEYDTFLEPKTVSIEECRYMWNYLTYVDAFTKRHQLQRNAITEVQFSDVGRFYYGDND